MLKKENLEKKFIASFALKDYQILTDDGFVDVVGLHETVPYIKYSIKTSGGKHIECADKHILFTKNDDEVFVEELSVGDVILTCDGEEYIEEVINTNEYETMYDFELCENSKHRYYTNGILSHNTHMVKILAKHLGIPCYIADSTKLTESGFVGQDVETVLTGLLREADGNILKAETGICILDEIDKLSRRGENASLTRDVGGEGVQQSLLKIVEGTKVGVPPNGGRIHPEQQLVEMDTTNILFIGMGAFDGLDKIVERRLNTSTIGFGTQRKVMTDDEKNVNLLNKVRQDDLRKFGIIPELIGRFPIITHTNPLSEDDLVRILTEPENSIIQQYRKMLYMDGVNLSFTDEALRLVAKVANGTKTGARGLRSILECVLTDIMFDYAGNSIEKDVKIDIAYVENSLRNKYDVDEIKKKAA